MDGKPVQVLKSKFGLDIVPLRSDVSINFGTNGQILVEFDEHSLKPKNILLKTVSPSGKLEQSVWDANADGIPDGRYLFGEDGEKAIQIFYQGSWYYKRNAGTNAVIIYEGKPLNLFFDGTTWRQNTNGVSSSQSAPASPGLGLR